MFTISIGTIGVIITSVIGIIVAAVICYRLGYNDGLSTMAKKWADSTKLGDNSEVTNN